MATCVRKLSRGFLLVAGIIEIGIRRKIMRSGPGKCESREQPDLLMEMERGEALIPSRRMAKGAGVSGKTH